MPSGVTQPAGTFVQSAVKTLQTLLHFIKNDTDIYTASWESH